MPIPTRRLLYLATIIVAIGLIASIWPAALELWYIALASGALIILNDLFLLYRNQPLSVQRSLQGSIPLGVRRRVGLRISNRSSQNETVSVYDHYPRQLRVRGLPVTTGIPAGQHADMVYTITPGERGKLVFQTVQLLRLSRFGFWQRNNKLAVTSETRVYPNFAAVSHLALMATDNRLSQLGIMKKRRRGEGQDFHQLREYREGDGLRQIDWKATSRTRKLISREYQDERDQEVIFLIDCGQRMTTKDGELSHFDHTLNALLLLSYVALRQGDSVGLATFSGESRWLSPNKGSHTIQHILNTVYDLQPSEESPDYAQAATDLLVRHKKRALVIILTNLRDEDSDDLLPAVKLLRKRHLVLLASLREEALDRQLEQQVDELHDAIRIAALHQYLQQRKKAFERIRSNNILATDVTPGHLTVELINSYLNIKRSGML